MSKIGECPASLERTPASNTTSTSLILRTQQNIVSCYLFTDISLTAENIAS